MLWECIKKLRREWWSMIKEALKFLVFISPLLLITVLVVYFFQFHDNIFDKKGQIITDDERLYWALAVFFSFVLAFIAWYQFYRLNGTARIELLLHYKAL